MTVGLLVGKGQNHCIVWSMGVTEGAVHYHLRRAAEGAEDGRKDRPFKADVSRRLWSVADLPAA